MTTLTFVQEGKVPAMRGICLMTLFLCFGPASAYCLESGAKSSSGVEKTKPSPSTQKTPGGLRSPFQTDFGTLGTSTEPESQPAGPPPAPATPPASPAPQSTPTGAESQVAGSPAKTEPPAERPSEQMTLSHFPVPLALKGPKREQAMAAYAKGRDLAMRENNYFAALEFFRQALTIEKSSTVLLAIAQCKKALNRPIEALFMFANALFENNKMIPEDRLPDRFVKTARDSVNGYLASLVSVRVVVPGNAALRDVKLNGTPVMSTNLFGLLNNGILVGGGVPKWVPRTAFSYSNDFVFFTKPGSYTIDFVFSEGRKLSLEKRKLTAKQHQINLAREKIPAKLVIENIQPGTRVLVKKQDRIIMDREFDSRRKQIAVGGLNKGSYDVEVSRRGFDDFSASYKLSRGEKERVVLDLQPKSRIKSWKLWLGVGLVAAAGIITTVVLLTANNDDPLPSNGEGMVTIGVF